MVEYEILKRQDGTDRLETININGNKFVEIAAKKVLLSEKNTKEIISISAGHFNPDGTKYFDDKRNVAIPHKPTYFTALIKAIAKVRT